jgi:ketosteroid isomerase-like protein
MVDQRAGCNQTANLPGCCERALWRFVESAPPALNLVVRLSSSRPEPIIAEMRSDPLRAAFDSRELDSLLDLLDEEVLWRGLPQPDGETPLCRSRAEVREVFVEYMANGGSGDPVIVGEAGDSVVVDPQPHPALPSALHQVFTFRGGRVALIEDYPDRISALQAVGLS